MCLHSFSIILNRLLKIYANQLEKSFSFATTRINSRLNTGKSLKGINKFKRALSWGHGRLHRHPERR